MPQRAPWVRDERARDRADPCPVTSPRGGNARSTQLALKRAITRDLGPVGPVFTSDRNLQPNFLLTIVGYLSWVPLLLAGPLVRPSYMLARVWAEARYLDLVNYLTAKFRLGAMSFGIGNQAFSLRSTNAWW